MLSVVSTVVGDATTYSVLLVLSATFLPVALRRTVELAVRFADNVLVAVFFAAVVFDVLVVFFGAFSVEVSVVDVSFFITDCKVTQILFYRQILCAFSI